jgi:sugar phosphate isomerase/epimerase
MQLGFVSAILPEQSLDEVLTFAADTGYACVEIMCWPPGKADRRYAGVSHIDVTRLDATEVDRIRGLCERLGVRISSLGYYPNPLSPDTAEAEVAVAHLHAVIDASAALGIGLVTSFIGRDPRKTVDENWPRFLEIWRPLVRHAEERSIRIGIENCPMLFSADEWPGGKNLATTPAIWRRMFQDLWSPNFGLNLDPSHLIWQQIDPAHAVHAFRDRLFHIHAKDARIDTLALNEFGLLSYPKLWHTPKLPGLGDVDWGAFFGALGDIDYAGPVAVEVEDRSFEGSVERRKASLIQSFRYLQQYVA